VGRLRLRIGIYNHGQLVFVLFQFILKLFAIRLRMFWIQIRKALSTNPRRKKFDLPKP